MPAEVVVPLTLTCVPWHPTETWGKTLLPRLVTAGVPPDLLNRSVYVIRFAGNFAIGHSGDESPTVYIGEGSFGSRIASHKKWARLLVELVGNFAFEICIATLRVRNQGNTYLDCEAALLHRFGERFGTAPLWNKQFERRRFQHHHYSPEKLDYVLGKRSGVRYH